MGRWYWNSLAEVALWHGHKALVRAGERGLEDVEELRADVLRQERAAHVDAVAAAAARAVVKAGADPLVCTAGNAAASETSWGRHSARWVMQRQERYRYGLVTG